LVPQYAQSGHQIDRQHQEQTVGMNNWRDNFDFKCVDRDKDHGMAREEMEAHLADGWRVETQYSVLNEDGVKRERYRFMRLKRND
jgi:hypothetical protein